MGGCPRPGCVITDVSGMFTCAPQALTRVSLLFDGVCVISGPRVCVCVACGWNVDDGDALFRGSYWFATFASKGHIRNGYCVIARDRSISEWRFGC